MAGRPRPALGVPLVILAAVVAFIAWLVANVRSNSEEIGIPTGYGYLDNPAQFPIPDSSFRQTQPVRDALVGLVNTFRVTIVGIIAATSSERWLGSAGSRATGSCAISRVSMSRRCVTSRCS